VTVTNNSTLAAADVNALKVSDRSFRNTKLVSVKASQGSCHPGGCDLGRMAPGASATITIVTQATQPGVVVNVVRVQSEEQESNYANNTAAALVHVTRPSSGVAGAEVAVSCHSLTVAPQRLAAGTTSIVLTTARTRMGQPVRGLTIYLRGLGLDRRARTNASGVARFVITPSHTGLVMFGRGPRALAVAGAPCTTLVGVLTATHTEVTG
jgi:hypothetical protein